ncbi:MAG: hypothetical protein JWR21_1096 [Herminiimonas sp.]|nr:hypothetical protein [Herminiimonas sp.]
MGPTHSNLRPPAPRWLVCLIIAGGLLLGGCATTFTSQVTSFHPTPLSLPEKSFVFERTQEQEGNLEYRHYEELVRYQLIRLGFIDANPASAARLKVSMAYTVSSRDVRVIETVPVDPWYGAPYYGPAWSGIGYRGPFYDPFWSMPPMMQQRDVQYRLFNRQLKIGIAGVSGNQKLFDVTVLSEGTNGALAAVMPYMIQSAFADFPGPSGVARVVELKMEN